MAKYIIKCNVGMDTYSKEIEAKNFAEAQAKASDFANQKSGFGKRYLRSFSVKRLAGSKK